MNYEQSELNKLDDQSTYKIKISGVDSSTNWLNISKKQLKQIKNILIDEG